MELTALDQELLDGLQVLTDQEIGRVQAHLAAGLPMRKAFGWDDNDTPSCFGCLVGTAMSHDTAVSRLNELDKLALEIFMLWANDQTFTGLEEALPQPILDRLAALLDMEWSRRHPAESTPPQQNLHRPVPEISTPSPSLLKEAVLV